MYQKYIYSFVDDYLADTPQPVTLQVFTTAKHIIDISTLYPNCVPVHLRSFLTDVYLTFNVMFKSFGF